MQSFLIEAYVGRISWHDLPVPVREPRVRLVRTILLPLDETCLWLVEAVDADRASAWAARLSAQRVVSAVTR